MRSSCAAEMAEYVPEEVGASGEFYVFNQLQQLLPNFTHVCWVSKFRLSYLPDCHSDGINNELGADFVYQDPIGKLTGSGKNETVYIEVKSMTQDAIGAFRMSINEWSLARICHASGGKGHSVRLVYVVAVVTSVTRMPRLSALIVDPVQQVANGDATCEVSELVFDPGTALRRA